MEMDFTKGKKIGRFTVLRKHEGLVGVFATDGNITKFLSANQDRYYTEEMLEDIFR